MRVSDFALVKNYKFFNPQIISLLYNVVNYL